MNWRIVLVGAGLTLYGVSAVAAYLLHRGDIAFLTLVVGTLSWTWGFRS